MGGSTGSRIVIVGGGITGAFTAYFAARIGAEVTLIERDRVGAHASGNNAGGLNPLHGAGIPGPVGALALASLRLHAGHWPDLRERSDIAFGARAVNRLHVALEAAELGALRERQSLYEATPGFAARWLDAAELRELEPRICPDALGGLWTGANAHIDPEPYTRAVGEAAVNHGVRLLTAEARGLLHDDARVTAVHTDVGEYPCDAVVIAPGPWTEGPSAWLGVPLPMEPVKGELLVAELASPPPAADISWRDVGVYALASGRLWLGGTEDRDGLNESPTASARERILAGVRRLLPGLGEPRVVGQFAGLRPVAPDGLPIVGIPSGWQNACVVAGSGRKGMLLGAGLGLAAAELVTLGRTEMPVEACSPDRRELR